MTLEFVDDFCTPCEPIAWIWHKGNDRIGHRPISVVDVNLPEIQLAEKIPNCSTYRVSCVECAAAHGSATSVSKNVRSAHSEWSKMSVRDQDEKGKERGMLGRQKTQSYHEVNACVDLFLIFYRRASTCLGFSDSPPLSSNFLTFVFLIPRRLALFGEWIGLSGMLFCMAPTGFTTKGSNPLALKAPPIVIRGAAHLDCAFSPYEFV